MYMLSNTEGIKHAIYLKLAYVYVFIQYNFYKQQLNDIYYHLNYLAYFNTGADIISLPWNVL